MTARGLEVQVTQRHHRRLTVKGRPGHRQPVRTVDRRSHCRGTPLVPVCQRRVPRPSRGGASGSDIDDAQIDQFTPGNATNALTSHRPGTDQPRGCPPGILRLRVVAFTFKNGHHKSGIATVDDPAHQAGRPRRAGFSSWSPSPQHRCSPPDERGSVARSTSVRGGLRARRPVCKDPPTRGPRDGHRQQPSARSTRPGASMCLQDGGRNRRPAGRCRPVASDCTTLTVGNAPQHYKTRRRRVDLLIVQKFTYHYSWPPSPSAVRRWRWSRSSMSPPVTTRRQTPESRGLPHH